MNEISDKRISLITSFNVTSADTDMKARLRLGGLVNMLLQSAIQSADALGFGFKDLRNEQLIWVLSRMTIEIDRCLKWKEEAIVETWPKDIEGLLYTRDFFVRDQQGDTVARATSGWLAIDMATRRPKNFEGINAGLLSELRTKYALELPPEKLPPVPAGEESSVRSGYFDIDLNGHVTSTRYVDWVMDTLPMDFLLSHYPKRFSINYMKETMPAESVQIRKHAAGDLEFHFEGINTGRGVTAFRSRLDF